MNRIYIDTASCGLIIERIMVHYGLFNVENAVQILKRDVNNKRITEEEYNEAINLLKKMGAVINDEY